MGGSGLGVNANANGSRIDQRYLRDDSCIIQAEVMIYGEL